MESESLPPHERSVYGLRLLKPSHPELRRLKGAHQPSSQGHKAWNATWLLIDFLQRQPFPQQLRVLDVGCGWGLAAIFCARHFAAAVTAADVDPEVFPFLQFHARLNQAEIRTLPASFAQIPDPVLRQQDLLIGADICFRAAMIDPLYTLLRRALEAGVAQIILADPGRFFFRQLAARCIQALGAREIDWRVQEPLILWPGASPQLRGRLLLIDRVPDPHDL